MHTIKLFLKFGSHKDIIDLYDNGTIYMNPIQLFREVEDKELRGDPYEGASKIKNYPPGQFTIESTGYTGNYLNLHIKESFEKILGNIYSLYCISSQGFPNPLEFKFDNRVKNFGKHCLMIKDNAKFLSLMENKLGSFGFKFKHGFIEYYNKNEINGNLHIFQKPMEFEYQKEFRFYLETDQIAPFSFQIGSLHGFAEIIETEAIMGLKLACNSQ